MATVLIAEDDANVRALLRMTLTNGGHRVVETMDGAEAWEKLPGSSADILILDVNMPEMDGFQVCRKVRQSEAFRRIPILMLTVNALVEDQVRGFDNGADEYLTKPLNPDVLLARIKALLARVGKFS